MDLQAVSDGLAAQAAKVTCSPPLNTAAHTPDGVAEPMAFVAEIDIDFDKAHNRGLDEVMVTMRVLVGRSDDKSAAARLNGLMSGEGSGSLKATLEAGRGAPGQPALGGACDDFHVQRWQGHRWYEHAGVTYLGGELKIRVIGPG